MFTDIIYLLQNKLQPFENRCIFMKALDYCQSEFALKARLIFKFQSHFT